MSSTLSSDLIDGKRKRSDSEFDSDTESVSSNYPGQNMDFSHPLCAKVMTELAKARFKIHPYSAIGGWSDPHMWSTLTRAVDGYNGPNKRDNIMEIIFMFEQLFLQGRYDDDLVINMMTVFGPGSNGDAGSLRTYNLDHKLLPVRRLHSDEVPPTTLQHDGGGPSNSRANQIRKKAKTMTFTTVSETHNFEKPMLSILTRNDMLAMYRDSTEHLTIEDKAIFLFYVPPGDITFQVLAMSPFAKRKNVIDSLVKKFKARNRHRRE